jgi:hypothetical protein
MYRKDFLLKQVNKFFEMLSKIILKIEDGNLKEAEEIVNQNLNASLIKQLLDEQKSEVFLYYINELKFQAHLLYLKYEIHKSKGFEYSVLKNNLIIVLKRLINLRPNEYDIELHQMLNKIEE